jgi:hypothetical protein
LGCRIASRTSFTSREVDLDAVIRFRLEDEEAELVAELLVEIVADETEVVLVAADVAREIEAPLLDDALPHREAEVIRVDREGRLLLRRERPHHVRMAGDRIQVEVLGEEVRLTQEPRVPVRRPALRS